MRNILLRHRCRDVLSVPIYPLQSTRGNCQLLSVIGKLGSCLNRSGDKDVAPMQRQWMKIAFILQHCATDDDGDADPSLSQMNQYFLFIKSYSHSICSWVGFVFRVAWEWGRYKVHPNWQDMAQQRMMIKYAKWRVYPMFGWMKKLLRIKI